MANARYPERFRVDATFDDRARSDTAANPTALGILFGRAVHEGATKVQARRLRDDTVVMVYSAVGFVL